MKNDAYNIAYKTLDSEAVKSERARAFGDDDIGQHSWTTPVELCNMISVCELNEGSVALDVGCGAGGPAIFVARQSGCHVTGVDIDEQGIETAIARASEQDLSHRCRFHVHNATEPFSVPDTSYDLIFAIDSVFHIPRRKEFLVNVKQIINDEGMLYFTDGGVVNGLISGDEFQLRSFNGPAFYVPVDYNEAILKQIGFEVVHIEDLTENNASIAQKRFNARADLQNSLVNVEGEVAYHGRQAYLQKVAELCQERRLCRYAYLARKLRRNSASGQSAQSKIGNYN